MSRMSLESPLPEVTGALPDDPAATLPGTPGALAGALPAAPMALPPAPEPDPFAGIDLGGGLIEFLVTGQIAPRRRVAYAAPDPVTPARPDAGPDAIPDDAPAGDAPPMAAAPRSSLRVVPYDGGLPPGTVIVNETRGEIFRVLPGRKAELHRTGVDLLRLAKLLTGKPLSSKPLSSKPLSGRPSPDMPLAGKPVAARP
jgi:hypothetical protein